LYLLQLCHHTPSPSCIYLNNITGRDGLRFEKIQEHPQEGIFLRKHKFLTGKHILFAGAFILIFIGITIFTFTYRRDEHLFTQVSSQLFREKMSGNTLSMHYTVAYPHDFGIYDYDAILPCYNPESRLAGQAQAENMIALLNSINSSKLTQQDRYTHTLLLNYLDNSLSLSTYPYYEEPLSPSSGMQSQLPILLAEYTFRTMQDVEDYLMLLDQTDEYFASLLLFEQEKAAAGLLMSASSLDKVLEQCETILSKTELAEGTHFLQTTFIDRLQELYDDGVVTKEEALKFISQNDRLLTTVMQPAYEALYDGLFILSDDAVPLEGLAAKPEGTTYYEYLLISETGSYRPVSEVKDMLIAKFDEEYQIMRDLVTMDPSLSISSYGAVVDSLFPYQDATQMLTDLQQQMRNDFPSLPDSETLPSVSVKAVTDSLAEYCAPAFYLTTPLDDTSANVIYINEQYSSSGLDLYTTLAHEGYPGHMYQSVYSNRTMLSQDENQARQILWYGGYQEGWAVYVEFIAFDYASNLMNVQNRSDLAQYIQLEKHSRSMQLCLYSLIDIMIHYENASYEQIKYLLNNMGITNESSVYAVYEYIVEEPANYLKYYLGYLEILELKEEAADLWGDSYTDYAFHTFILDCGPSDFDTLRSCLMSAEIPGTTGTALERPATTALPIPGSKNLSLTALSPK